MLSQTAVFAAAKMWWERDSAGAVILWPLRYLRALLGILFKYIYIYTYIYLLSNCPSCIGFLSLPFSVSSSLSVYFYLLPLLINTVNYNGILISIRYISMPSSQRSTLGWTPTGHHSTWSTMHGLCMDTLAIESI